MVKLFFLKFLLVSAIGLSFNFSFCSNHISDVTLHIFIHGSIGSCIPKFLVRDRQKLRALDILRHDQLLFQEGLHRIPYSLIQASLRGELSTNEARHAGYYVVAAYDQIQRLTQSVGTKNIYASFGWSGDLDQQERKSAGFLFYQQLATLIDSCYQRYNIKPTINIFAHSHGGNVALWLPEAERASKQNIQVETLYLIGTPFQPETAHFINSSIFKTIISCYADGDYVPTLDKFSTHMGKSYKKMSDLISLSPIVASGNLRRCDVRLSVNRSSKIVDHFNMWGLGRTCSHFSNLAPLPLLVLAPLIIDQASQLADTTHAEACIHAQEKNLFFHIHDVINKNSSTKCSADLCELLAPIREAITRFWHPLDTSQSLFFNYKSYLLLKQALSAS
jgi:hypothetical protein